MSNELKPCPFCGGEPTVDGPENHVAPGVGVGYAVYCNNEDCYLGGMDAPLFYRWFSEAVAAWNARAERTCEWVPGTDKADDGRQWFTGRGEAYLLEETPPLLPELRRAGARRGRRGGGVDGERDQDPRDARVAAQAVRRRFPLCHRRGGGGQDGRGTDSPWHMDTLGLPAAERSRLRSKTFPGIARAMAEQWGGLERI